MDRICAHSSPVNIIHLSRTCKLANASVREYYRRAYSINRHLERWFQDPLAFRRLQQRTTTLISGSCALQFFDRTFYPESDLDLFTPWNQVPEVAVWLVGAGYVYMQVQGQKPPFDLARTQDDWLQRDSDASSDISGPDFYPLSAFNVIKVYTFYKIGRTVDAAHLKVQIIGTSIAPIASVLKFHSTCVMNAISYSTAYALYPWHTFEERCSLITPTVGLEQQQALQKYAQRGWGMESASDYGWWFELSSTGTAYTRWIDDRHTWAIPLSLDGIPETYDPDPVATTSWRLSIPKNDDPYYARMSFMSFHDELLRHEYVIPGDQGDERCILALRRAFNRLHWIRKCRGRGHVGASETEIRRAEALVRVICEAFQFQENTGGMADGSLSYIYSWVDSLVGN
ncbi:hypothetical protein BV25DRAFT_1826890 [Artomyces pyxidatus]|uniref:Uncharacterized protein n=1 Tax=Artomyces pyxidatus TaxID=48021 RepID=A0ACB8SXZ6_9AGAM|nr:hypothetical protein BV25DRAFT_1826890 [Artomyces pyxidatus]